MEETIRRIGGYIEVVDGEGCRHCFPASSRVEISDSDCLRNEYLVMVGNRRIAVMRPYDEVVEALLAAELRPLSRR